MSADGPYMTKWILQCTHAVAVELVGQRLQRLRTRSNRLVEDFVCVLHVQQHAHWSVSRRFWTPVAHLGMFIRHHDRRITDLDLGMADPAVRGRHSHHLCCSEGLLVEIDRLRGAVNDQVRSYCVVSLRNRLDFVRHDYSPLKIRYRRIF